ncbi:MAG: OadG family protein [Muribaculaceae bacterium]|nr:OadG family protein [Muribaculaceae bacterium]
MNKKGIIIVFIAVFTALASMAQGRMDLRINEVMVVNESNEPDEYGDRSAWIELFNASHGTNAIEKMFITNKRLDNSKRVDVATLKNDPAFHEIRRGDVATKVAPRTHVLFYADGDSARGTFHLPFELQAEKGSYYIALYDVNGELVDEVEVPDTLSPDHSWARMSEEAIDLHKASRKYDAAEWSARIGKSDADAITPGKFNSRPVNTNIQEFKEKDGHGFILSLTAMGVVFTALALLFICFMLFGKAFAAKDKKVAAVKVDDDVQEEVEQPAAQPGSNDEAIAAIFMALYQHLNAHDEESGILTFDHSHDMPSAWASKGHLLLHVPEHHES